MDNGYHEKRQSTRRREDECLEELLNKIIWGMNNGGLTAEMCQRIHEWYRKGDKV